MSTKMKTEIHLKINAYILNKDPATLLAENSELTRGQIKQAMDKGAVWLEHGKNVKRLRRVKSALKVGNTLHLYYDPEILEQEAKLTTLISDESSYSIWFKPAGMFSQGSKWSDHCTITRAAEKQLKQNVYAVHRLDRATSGLMIIAHSKKIAAELSRMFADREIDKTYHAVVAGDFSDRELPLRIDQELDGKQAITVITKILDQDESSSTLEVKIETGRKHQIRQHLALIGFPALGDRLYADDASVDLQLTAFQLDFICPVEHRPKSWSLSSVSELRRLHR